MASELQDQLQEIVGPAYHIERELGGAGMSRVFLARETDLDRQVVIKVLPPDLAAGINADRFRREIQLAARLQHPHIVQLLAAGAKGSLLYYTMPYIDGEDLRARIKRDGPLRPVETARILRQVADALSYAHSQGVVHRDIKPENILLSGNHALVTDFGVSKAVSSATTEAHDTGITLTELGMTLGTPAYMAPEQAAADPNIDHRADIYALGIVGYELLAGKPPFTGMSHQKTLAAQITTLPVPITEHRSDLPDSLAFAVMKSLEKHPPDRWNTAAELDAALELCSISSGSGATPAAATGAQKTFSWTPQRIAVTAGVIGLIATGLFASTIAFRRGSTALAVGDTHQVTNFAGMEVDPTISPDGRMVAYRAATLGGDRIFVKQIAGSGHAVEVADSSMYARWRPDGSHILYESNGRNYLVPALGGSATLVSGLDGLHECTYSNRGDRLACVRTSDQALVIAGINGENQRVVPQTAGSDGVMNPSWSMDDKLIAFSRGNVWFYNGSGIGNIAPSAIWAARADGGNPVRVSDVTHLNVSPVFMPDGSLLFVSSLGGNRDIYTQRLASDLSPRGAPQRLTTGLNAHTISIDATGTLLAYSVFTTSANIWSTPVPSSPAESPQLHQVTTGNQTIENLGLSPDGKWLTYDSNINGNQDVFKVLVSGGDPQQLTHNGADNFVKSWSPDGTQIAFHTMLKGNRDVYVMDASGEHPTPVAATGIQERDPFWMPDGRGLYVTHDPDSIFIVMRDSKTATGWGTQHFAFRADGILGAPDGSVAALEAGKPGQLCATCASGLYLASVDGTNPKFIPTPVSGKSIAEVGQVLWSRDSKHLYAIGYEHDGTSAIWQLPINGDPERRLVHFTDPSRQFYRINNGMDERDFYLIIGERQSDIWTMKLEKK